MEKEKAIKTYELKTLTTFTDKNKEIVVLDKIMEDYTKLHCHDYFEIEFVYEGTGYQVFNGQKYDIKKGSIFLLGLTDFHEITFDEPCKIFNISFDYSFKYLR